MWYSSHMEKHCKHCDRILPIEQFTRDASRPDGRCYRCRECEWKRVQAYRQSARGKAGRVDQIKRRKQRGTVWYDEYRRKHPCVFCGETEIVCLDLHHKDPKAKIKDVSRMAFDAYSESRMESEVAKCVVVCANCHRKLHAGLITL